MFETELVYAFLLFELKYIPILTSFWYVYQRHNNFWNAGFASAVMEC
jgi:hypothetical protein